MHRSGLLVKLVKRQFPGSIAICLTKKSALRLAVNSLPVTSNGKEQKGNRNNAGIIKVRLPENGD
ncbi:MAG: hypothetical protein CVU54_03505 [Deltaproteobacteria bacterium HGW-Deltaproteobacteria-12]|nr:MAG: hypothetical protein CVU54_03505 [Deltaproteobacteria bacterium HGW-Deltaproteobacteria-12]